MTLTRKDVLKMISKRIVEAVVLSHHLMEYDEPHEGYVFEKTHPDNWPSLDTIRKDIFHQIKIILKSHFGIEINSSRYP